MVGDEPKVMDWLSDSAGLWYAMRLCTTNQASRWADPGGGPTQWAALRAEGDRRNGT